MTELAGFTATGPAEPWSPHRTRIDWRDDQGRRKLIRRLLENPAVGESLSASILANTSQEDLRHVAQDGRTGAAVSMVIDNALRERAAAAQALRQAELDAKHPPLPDDDQLAAQEDPQAAPAALVNRVRLLPTARRAAGVGHILASRFRTAQIAWRLPAGRLPEHEEHGPRLARELSELRGSSPERWSRLREQADPELSPNLSTAVLLERRAKV